MKQKFYYLLCFVGLFVLPSCVSKSFDYTVEKTPQTPHEVSVEEDVIRMTNQLRTSHGLKPVKRHKGLSQLSLEHSVFMANNQGNFDLIADGITHYGFESRSDRTTSGLNRASVGENVLRTVVATDTGNHITQKWYQSKSHRPVLLGEQYRHVGVGIRYENGAYLATMLMAEPEEGQLPPFVGPPGF